MSRPSYILNKDITNTILNYISNGNYIKTACLAAGITEETFYHWQRLAEAYDPNNGSSENKVYYEFSVLLKKAREQSVTTNVSLIQEAAKKPQNWPAAAWLLERTRPDDYAKREPAIIVESKVLIALQDTFEHERLRNPKVIEGEVKEIEEKPAEAG